MFEEFLKEFFGTKTFDDLFNEVFDKKVNTNDVKDNNNNHSYFHSIKDEYKNGEHVSHSEKEIKDGKLIKDVDNSIEFENKNVCKCDKKLYEKKEIEKECKRNDYDKLKGIIKHLEQSLRSAENALAEKDKKITELESKLAEVTLDKEYLLKKFEQVKNVFSD